MRPTRLPGLLLAVPLAAACGDNLPPLFAADVFAPSPELQARCEAPREGIDPFTGAAFPDEDGSEETEKLWLRSWTHELYLWYREVPDPDPAGYPTPLDYFGVLRTQELSPSGNRKDRFHFTYPTDEWEALSQTGVSAGYGATFTLISAAPPRQIVVAYNEPGSPAAEASLDRGDELLAIDGVDVIEGNDVDALNAGLLPSDVGETHTFQIRDVATGASRTIELTSAAVESAPVQRVSVLDTADGPVGYFLFNDHIATAEPALRDAVTELADAGVTDLVVDLRYNGGGYLVVASQLAYQVAGPGPTAGQPFESIEFNDQYSGIHPLSGEPIEPMPFVDATVGLSGPEGLPLSNLGLERVFVLTGPGTCSASESFMNGLRGVGVEVIQIGATTCGKPYGFYPQDNCGTTYFSIQFRGVNAAGFGDYADGFVPGGAGEAGVAGCQVDDDFGRDLGDPNERRLAAALHYRAEGTCPAGARRGAAPAEGRVMKSIWQENRILGP